MKLFRWLNTPIWKLIEEAKKDHVIIKVRLEVEHKKQYRIRLVVNQRKGNWTDIHMDWPEHKALMEWTEAKKFYKWFFGKPNNSYYVFDAYRRKTMIRRVDITGFTLELVEKKDENEA